MKTTVEYYEQIYTSAATLLIGANRSDLGIVAQSRDFPQDACKSVEQIRSYRLLPTIPPDQPDRHPPKIVARLCGNARYCLSRVVHAGADHTGRVTPLAHHLAFNIDTSSSAVWAGELLDAAMGHFRDAWEGEPEWLESPSRMVLSPSDRVVRAPVWAPFIGGHWKGLLCEIASRLADFAQQRRAVVIPVAPQDGKYFLPLLADCLSVLPDRFATGVTHVYDSSDVPQGAQIIVAYQESPFMKQCLARRDPSTPFVIDRAGNPSNTQNEGLGQVVRHALDHSDNWLKVRARIDQAVVIHSQVKSWAVIPPICQLTMRSPDQWNMGNLEACAEIMRAEPSSTPYLKKLVRSKLSKCVQDGDGRWPLVFHLIVSGDFPPELRGEAWRLILDGGRLPDLLESLPDASGPSNHVIDDLAKLTRGNRQWFVAMLQADERNRVSSTVLKRLPENVAMEACVAAHRVPAVQPRLWDVLEHLATNSTANVFGMYREILTDVSGDDVISGLGSFLLSAERRNSAGEATHWISDHFDWRDLKRRLDDATPLGTSERVARLQKYLAEAEKRQPQVSPVIAEPPDLPGNSEPGNGRRPPAEFDIFERPTARPRRTLKDRYLGVVWLIDWLNRSLAFVLAVIAAISCAVYFNVIPRVQIVKLPLVKANEEYTLLLVAAVTLGCTLVFILFRVVFALRKPNARSGLQHGHWLCLLLLIAATVFAVWSLCLP